MLHRGAEVEGAGDLHFGRFAGGDPRGGEDGDEAGRRGGGDLPWGDGEVFDADEDVERGDGFADRADEESGQREGGQNAEGDAGQAEDKGFAEEEGADFAARGADGAEDADLAAGAHDRGGHRVVDEEHPDEERDEAEGGEVELETGQHFADLFAALLRGGNDHIGGHEGACGGCHGVRVGVFGEEDLDRIEFADFAEQFLRPANVHRGGADVRERGGVVGLEDETDPEAGGASLRVDAEDVALFESELLRELAGQRDGVALAQPGFDVDGCTVGPNHAEGFEGRVGEGIDAEQAEVFAGMIGQGKDSLHDRCARGHPGNGGQGGEEGFVERTADFEVRFAGQKFDAGPERAVGAVVGDHDGEENAHPEGDAHHIHRGQQLVAPGVAQDLAQQDGRPVTGHVCETGPATAASCKARWRACTSRSPETLALFSARLR